MISQKETFSWRFHLKITAIRTPFLDSSNDYCEIIMANYSLSALIKVYSCTIYSILFVNTQGIILNIYIYTQSYHHYWISQPMLLFLRMLYQVYHHRSSQDYLTLQTKCRRQLSLYTQKRHLRSFN